MLKPSLQLVLQLCRRREKQGTDDTYFQMRFFLIVEIIWRKAYVYLLKFVN